MAGVEQAPDVFVLLCPRPEDGVDLVEEDRWQSRLVGHLAEQVGRRGVDRVHRLGDQQLGHLEGSALSTPWLGRQEGDPRRRIPLLHGVGVGDPEHMGDAGVLARIGDEPLEERLDVVEQLVRAEAGIIGGGGHGLSPSRRRVVASTIRWSAGHLGSVCPPARLYRRRSAAPAPSRCGRLALDRRGEVTEVSGVELEEHRGERHVNITSP